MRLYLIIILVPYVLYSCVNQGHTEIHDYAKRHLTSFDIIEERRIVRKRSYGSDATFVKFEVFKKQLELRLVPTQPTSVSSSFSVIVKDEDAGAYTNIDPSILWTDYYSGHVRGDPTSKVTGYFVNNKFIGTVYAENTVLTLESVATITGNESDTRVLAYYEHNIKDSQKRDQALCGYLNLNSSSSTPQQPEPNASPPQSDSQRLKRSADSNIVCTLLMVADYAYFSRIGLGQVGTTVRSLVHTVDDVNQVYHATKFVVPQTKEILPQFGFELASVIVMSTPEADKEHFNYLPGDDTLELASKVLEKFGDFKKNQINFTYFCLVHLLTYQRMEQNVLGLAYLNGMCQLTMFPAKHGRRAMTRQNTGFTTYRDMNGYPVLSRRATLVTAHELGHNMGSEHDPAGQLDCSPKPLDGGAFVMHPVAVMGYYKNNDKFSPCSNAAISIRISLGRTYCLKVPSSKLCGDHKVDKGSGEECDAGIVGDRCCGKNCRLHKDANCSDANSPCCLECKPAPQGFVCTSSSILRPCIGSGRCDGTSKSCPTAPNLSDGTVCNSGIGECLSGVCKSICHPSRPCDCPEAKDSCHLCCVVGASCVPRLTADNSGRLVPLPLDHSCGTDSRCLGNGTCAPNAFFETGRPAPRLFAGNSKRMSPGGSFMSNNIVLVTVVISLLIYVPACMVWSRRNQQDAWPSDAELDFGVTQDPVA